MADYGPDETLSEGNEDIWPNRTRPRLVLRFLALISLLSVILNTPKTFEHVPHLRYGTFIADIICVLAFTAEMVSKIKDRHLILGDKAYLKDRWCQFDACMLFFIMVSVLLQTLEIAGVAKDYSPLSMLRAPR